MVKRAEYRVYGIVQGVGYRYFVYRNAKSLNLTGFAKNMYDGTVWVIAEGEEVNLKKLYDILLIGPTYAYVKKVEVEYGEPTGEFLGFEIK